MATSFQTFKTLYLDSAQAVANIDVAPFSDFDAKSNGIAAVAGAQSLDIETQFNRAFPQNADEISANLQLASSGAPSQYPETPAVLTLEAQGVVTNQVYLIPVGMTITADSGAIYTVIATDASSPLSVTITSDADVFTVISELTGQNTSQPVDTILTLTPPIVSESKNYTINTAIVRTATDGANAETLVQAQNRLIELRQTPLAGTRSTDFKQEVIDPDLGVTDAVVLNANEVLYPNGTVQNFAVFLIGGTLITDSVLNQGLVTPTAQVFNRSVGSGIIAIQQAKLNNAGIIGARPLVNTVDTQQLAADSLTQPMFRVQVSLQYGYSLNTQITLDNNIFTISQLIQRELRRAICAQPYGATLTKDFQSGQILSSIIPMLAIEQQLDDTLGTSTKNGTLGSYLVTRAVMVWNGTQYVYDREIVLDLGIPTDTADPLMWIYDISTTPAKIYSNIMVTL